MMTKHFSLVRILSLSVLFQGFALTIGAASANASGAVWKHEGRTVYTVKDVTPDDTFASGSSSAEVKNFTCLTKEVNDLSSYPAPPEPEPRDIGRLQGAGWVYASNVFGKTIAAAMIHSEVAPKVKYEKPIEVEVEGPNCKKTIEKTTPMDACKHYANVDNQRESKYCYSETRRKAGTVTDPAELPSNTSFMQLDAA